jgi:hypothetical protein
MASEGRMETSGFREDLVDPMFTGTIMCMVFASNLAVAASFPWLVLHTLELEEPESSQHGDAPSRLPVIPGDKKEDASAGTGLVGNRPSLTYSAENTQRAA